MALQILRNIIDLLKRTTDSQVLSRTTYCALLVQRTDNLNVVYVAQAGKSASAFSERIMSNIERIINNNTVVVNAVRPVQGQGTWHMNDAEQQALTIALDHINNSPEMFGSRIVAVKATRRICESCAHTLRNFGFNINGDEASL